MCRTIMTAFVAATLMAFGAAWADGSGYDKDKDQGTAEDILQTPAGEIPNAPAEEMGTSEPVVEPSDQGVAETAVPSASQLVSGKINTIDKKSGYFTLQTEDGKDIRLHADPKLLKEQNLKKGAEVTAQYEMRGDMKHVTIIQEGGAVRSPTPGETPNGGMR